MFKRIKCLTRHIHELQELHTVTRCYVIETDFLFIIKAEHNFLGSRF